MRVRTIWLACLLGTGVVLAPGAARAQTEDGAVPHAVFPIPTYHNHPAKGGFYTTGEFVLLRQTNPLEKQPIAFRGFIDATGEFTGRVGQWVGTPTMALNADDAGGPGTYQPGFKVGLGYRFRDGVAVELSWMHLAKSQYQHVATGIPPLFNLGAALENSFLTAPVYNFPNDFAGPDQDLEIGTTRATYGIWNAADVMSIDFIQRTEQWQLLFRYPIHEMECWRTYGVVGPRFFWIWERFRWRTVDQDPFGGADPSDVAVYTNIVSNRMYGAFIGLGNEWYLGHGVGFSLDLEAAVYLDVAKERAKYELGAKNFGSQNKRARVEYAVVPEARAYANLHWYPIEGVQFRLGYDFFALFNTVAAPKPVSFNWGAIDPPWARRARFFDGIQAGVGLIW